jgi:hypothetical protein
MDNGDTGEAGEVVADQKPGSTQARRKLVGPVGHALRGVLKTRKQLHDIAHRTEQSYLCPKL